VIAPDEVLIVVIAVPADAGAFDLFENRRGLQSSVQFLRYSTNAR